MKYNTLEAKWLLACIGKLLVNHNLFLKISEWVRARNEGTNSAAIGFNWLLISFLIFTSLVLWVTSFVRFGVSMEELDLGGVWSSRHGGFVTANEVVLSTTAMIKPKDESSDGNKISQKQLMNWRNIVWRFKKMVRIEDFETSLYLYS